MRCEKMQANQPPQTGEGLYEGRLERRTAGHRQSTVEFYRRAVTKVVLAMRARLDEPWRLPELARLAGLSRWHFDRVFHEVTGVSPRRFLSAVRLQAAKEMLLTSDQRVTDICLAVGYSSLGTFVSRFSRSVGVSPERLRCAAQNLSGAVPVARQCAPQTTRSPLRSPLEVRGRIDGSVPARALIFVGLSDHPGLPTVPTEWGLLPAPGSFAVRCAREGTYYVYAVGLAGSAEPRRLLVPAPGDLWIGFSSQAVPVLRGTRSEEVRLVLRPATVFDPPLLVALPVLLLPDASRRAARGVHASGSCRQVQEATLRLTRQPSRH
jgi:AraC-like DNA-binding protein